MDGHPDISGEILVDVFDRDGGLFILFNIHLEK